jgi:hypothetical protein
MFWELSETFYRVSQQSDQIVISPILHMTNDRLKEVISRLRTMQLYL